MLLAVNLFAAEGAGSLARLVLDGRLVRTVFLGFMLMAGPLLAPASGSSLQGPSRAPNFADTGKNSQIILPSSSVNIALPILKLRDDFNYNSTSAMIAAGWSECSAAPESYTRVSNGILTLENDGVAGAALCWTQLPQLVHDWNITARARWSNDTSNPADTIGSLLLGAKTNAHFYQFEADGFNHYYSLYVDGRVIMANDYYTPTLNAWRTFGLAMKNHVLTGYIQGKVELTYTESAPDTDLTLIHLPSVWQTTNSYDYVTANQLLPTTPDFLIYANPLTQTLAYGATATFTISLYSINNFNKTIALAVQQSNTTTTPDTFFNPPTITLPKNSTSTATLTVPTTFLTNPQVTLPIIATSGSLSHQVTVSLSVTSPPTGQDFAITASPNNLTVILPNIGASPTANYTITVTSLNGFNGTVRLQAGFNWNPGFSLSLTPTIVHLSPNGYATAILMVSDPGISANTSVNITGLSITGSHYVTVKVEFDPANFKIVGSPSARFIKTGLSSTVSLSIYSDSFYGRLDLNAQISPSYPGGPSVSFTPGSVYLTGSGSVKALMTISTSAYTPSGNYNVMVTGSNYFMGSTIITVIVGPIPRLPGVTPGMRASYSLSISSYTGATFGIVTTVTSVEGWNVTYRTDFLVDGYDVNSTMSWLDVATGETSIPTLLPLAFVATNLNLGDPVYLSGGLSSYTITSKMTLLLLGAHRLSISAHRSSSSAGSIDSTWDASTGILYSIDATFLLNSTYVSIQYRLLETSAWAKLTSGFSRSPTIGPVPLTVYFISDPAGGQTPYTYKWDFGDGGTSTLPNPTHRFTKPGNYTVKLTTMDGAGDSVFSSSLVTVSGPSQIPNQPSNVPQMIARFAFSNYQTILAGLGGVWVTLAALAVFLVMRPKRKTAT